MTTIMACQKACKSEPPNSMYRRNITDKIIKFLEGTPLILINGVRQTGKSTLTLTAAEHASC